MRLSVSIVTYNSSAVIESCLESLCKFPQANACELHLIDNDSTDQTPAILAAFAAGPLPENMRVHIHRAKNLGYGHGHNIAIHAVQSDLHVVCNPDIVFIEDTLDRLASFMATHPECALVAPQVLNSDRSLQPLNKRHPTLSTLFLRRFAPAVVQKLFTAKLRAYEMFDVGYERVCEVPFISGAFFMARTEALKKVQGFDENFFLYFEDADLSRRLYAAGYRGYYTPSTQVVHAWARGAHKNLKLMGIFIRSACRYFNKWGWKF